MSTEPRIATESPGSSFTLFHRPCEYVQDIHANLVVHSTASCQILSPSKTILSRFTVVGAPNFL